MIYRHKTTGKEIRVLAFPGYGVQFQALLHGKVCGVGTMGKHVLDTEYEMTDSDK